MPVEGCRLVAEGIVNIDDNPISHIDVYLRAWPLSVDAYNRPRKPIRACSHPCDFPVVIYSLRERQAGKAKQQQSKREHDDEELLAGRIEEAVFGRRTGIVYTSTNEIPTSSKYTDVSGLGSDMAVVTNVTTGPDTYLEWDESGLLGTSTVKKRFAGCMVYTWTRANVV